MLAALHMDILCPLSWRWLWGSGRPWYIRLMNVLVLTEEYLLVIMVMKSCGSCLELLNDCLVLFSKYVKNLLLRSTESMAIPSTNAQTEFCCYFSAPNMFL